MQGFWFSLPGEELDTLQGPEASVGHSPAHPSPAFSAALLRVHPSPARASRALLPAPAPRPRQTPGPPMWRLHLHLLRGHGRTPSGASRASIPGPRGARRALRSAHFHRAHPPAPCGFSSFTGRPESPGVSRPHLHSGRPGENPAKQTVTAPSRPAPRMARKAGES